MPVRDPRIGRQRQVDALDLAYQVAIRDAGSGGHQQSGKLCSGFTEDAALGDQRRTVKLGFDPFR